MDSMKKMLFEEVAALIASKLKENKIDVVLSGGACAQIYTNSAYITGDLDFVTDYISIGSDGEIDKVMKDLGFKKTTRLYEHVELPFMVEFPPGPLGIGEQNHVTPVEMEFRTGKLRLLSPTDSLKDRLASYFYSNDMQSFENALLICKMNKVDMKNIREWAKKEKPEMFKVFEEKIVDLKI